MLEGVDIPEDLHNDYLGLLEELKKTEDDFNEKVDCILSVIQSRKHWLTLRKAELDRLQQLIGLTMFPPIRSAPFIVCLLHKVQIERLTSGFEEESGK